MAFNNIIRDCKTGWKTETVRNKKLTVCFVSEQLALLLVLCRQVEKAKEVAHGDIKLQEQRTLCSESASEGGVPRNSSLKQAFRQLWNAYETPLRNYVVTEKKKKSAIYCTPSLSLQLTGQRNQDQISWGSWAKCPSNCPVCIHASPMPCSHLRRSSQQMLVHVRQPKQMVAMKSSRQRLISPAAILGCHLL